MFKKLRQIMTDNPKKFDPLQLGDPVAMQTEWTYSSNDIPVGLTWYIHRLVKVSSSRLEFQAIKGILLFCRLSFIVGVVVFLGALYKILSGGASFYSLYAIVAVPFFMICIILLRGFLYSGDSPNSGPTPIVFDKQIGFFWKGRKNKHEASGINNSIESAKLEDVHALQLVSMYGAGGFLRGGKGVAGGKLPYFLYELNLILQDGKRINVVSCGNQVKLHEDTRTLSAFLGKPVWDAITDYVELMFEELKIT